MIFIKIEINSYIEIYIVWLLFCNIFALSTKKEKKNS